MGISDSLKSIYILDKVHYPSRSAWSHFEKLFDFSNLIEPKLNIFSFILLSKGYLIAEALYHRVLSTFFDWAGKNFTLTLLSGHQAVCAYFPSPTKEQLQQLKWATFGSGSNSGFWLGFFPKFTVETAAQGDCETFWWRGARVMRSLDS